MDASSLMRVTPITFARFIGTLFGTQRVRHWVMAYGRDRTKEDQRDQSEYHPCQSVHTLVISDDIPEPGIKGYRRSDRHDCHQDDERQIVRVEHLPVMLSPDKGKRERPAEPGDTAATSSPSKKSRTTSGAGLLTSDGIMPNPSHRSRGLAAFIQSEDLEQERPPSIKALLSGHHPWSSKSRFSRTARNLSRILGLNDLSSASVSKPSSINSEGMEDKTLMTAAR